MAGIDPAADGATPGRPHRDQRRRHRRRAPTGTTTCASALCPTLHGERVCIAHPRPGGRLPFGLETSASWRTTRRRCAGSCNLPSGIVLVTGPTGSGKTTLFYSMLQELDRDHQAVMSVEDPVEYDIPGVAQIEVKPQDGADLRPRPAQHPAPGPRRDPLRRDTRHRDGERGRPVRADRPPGADRAAREHRARRPQAAGRTSAWRRSW